MKKTIAVKSAKRNGKVVKAYKKTIDVSNVSEKGMGNEYAQRRNIVFLPSETDLREWWNYEPEEIPSEEWKRADKFIRSKLSEKEYAEMADNPAPNGHKDFYNKHVLKNKVAPYIKTGNPVKDNAALISKYTQDKKLLGKHNLENLHLHKMYHEKILNLRNAASEVVEEKQNEVIQKRDNKLSALIKKGKRLVAGVNLTVVPNSKLVTVNVKSGNNVHHIEVTPKELTNLAKGIFPKNITVASVTVNSPDTIHKGNMLSNTYHNVSFNEDVKQKAIKGLKRLI